MKEEPIRIGVIMVVALMLSVVCMSVTITAQDDDSACFALVETALDTVGDACNDMARNQACYGNPQVTGSFWDDDYAASFSEPADRVPVLDLQTITSLPLNPTDEEWGLAVLNVQADIPDTIPGQGVTFLLMGDVSLENEVAPDQAAVPVAPVIGMVVSGANLRSGPTTEVNNVIDGATAGDELALTGVDASGNWFQVVHDDGGKAWIHSSLVNAGDTSGLPVTDSTPRYSSMQAFYLAPNFGSPACAEAPNALVIHNGSGQNATMRINGLNVTLGSTVIFTMAEIGDTVALVITLVEGHMDARSRAMDLTLANPGETVALSLNIHNRIDDNATVVDFDPDDLGERILAACENALQSTLFPEMDSSACDIEITPVGPAPTEAPQPVTSAPSSGLLDDIGDSDACTIAARNTVNLRGGPGTNYALQGQLAAGVHANPDGQATGTDNLSWWRLSEGTWVRANLTDKAGACDSVPVVEAPEPPAPAAPVASGNSGGSFVHFMINDCAYTPITAGDTVQLTIGIGVPGGPWPTEEQAWADLATFTPIVYLDGVALPTEGQGVHVRVEGDGYGSFALAMWIATRGTHIVSSNPWTDRTHTCSFTVE